ncbi:hypothetical protein ON010_g6151 [Phytophthora cinnamomi]|nr:hypothetical protein ON010_g6151 [Phytophthora cinnamomi]
MSADAYNDKHGDEYVNLEAHDGLSTDVGSLNGVTHVPYQVKSEFARQMMAEFFATFICVVFGLACTAQVTLSSGTAGSFVTVALAWGFAYFLGITVGGGVSGANLNPTVTVALALLGMLPWKKVPFYILAQTVASYVAAMVVYILYRPMLNIVDPERTSTNAIFATYPHENVGNFTCFLTEFFAAALLVVGFLALLDEHNRPIGRKAGSSGHRRARQRHRHGLRHEHGPGHQRRARPGPPPPDAHGRLRLARVLAQPLLLLDPARGPDPGRRRRRHRVPGHGGLPPPGPLLRTVPGVPILSVVAVGPFIEYTIVLGGVEDQRRPMADAGASGYVLAIAGIVDALIAAYEAQEPVNMTRLKNDVAKQFRLPSMPKLVDIISAVPEEYRDRLLPFLKAKPVRTASGIAVVAVMCKPHRCPHIAMTGNICVYCPGGPDSDFEYSTQSYTGYEPTSMRAIRARYDPALQTRHRVAQLKRLGHSVDKVEFIVMGGTFLSLDARYRDYFIRNLHDALSGHSSTNVEEAVRYSEQSSTKCTAITIETRPDYCLKPHLHDMLRYGCTRIEIGVQSVYEDVARDTNRGHTVAAVSHCFQLAKDCGFKIVAHLMPDLPNMGMERDLAGFREYFENPRFRSDGIKLYPTLVIRGTGLYELWKTGAYKNYSPEDLVDLMARLLALVPPWTRVYRVQRDIPMPLVTSGVEHGNLRELALARMRDLGLVCNDVRTREVGIKGIHDQSVPDQVELVRRDYVANGGWETFLSYEDPQQNILIGLLRLRQASVASFRDEIPPGCSIVRELHVYGSSVPLHARDPTKFQHQGFGTLLMEEAERIALEEHRSHKVVVIAGVGTRNYYRKLGYEIDGPYMSKYL